MRTWAWLGTVLGVLVLTLAASVSLLGGVAADQLVSDERARQMSPQPQLLDPDNTDGSGVRPLPLLPRGALLDRHQLGDRRAVETAIGRLTPGLGLADLTETLVGVSFEEGLGEDADDYPYAYGLLDVEVRARLDAAAVRRDPDAVVELASLLVAVATDAEGFSAYPQPRGSWAAASAFSLLNAARELGNTCNLQTNLVFVVTSGQMPQPDVVEEETATAQDLCGLDDPTPLWIRARYLARTTNVGDDDRAFSRAPSIMRDEARAVFAELQSQFGELPTGYAGEADLLLGWADEAEAIRNAPFQVRAWRREALGLYEQARSRSPDARLLAGHARALSGLGRHDEALEVVAAALEQRPHDVAVRILRADILSRDDRHAEAAAAVAEEADAVQLDWWMREAGPFGPDFTTPAYAVDATPLLTLPDATFGGLGGATVDDLDFVPVSRYWWDEPMCRDSVRFEALVLANDAATVTRVLGTPAQAAPLLDCQVFAREYWAQTYAAIAALDQGDASAFEGLMEAFVQESGPEYIDEHRAEMYDRWQDLLRADGQFDRAIAAAEQWADAMPGDARTWQRLGEALLLAGEAPAAEPHLETASEMLDETARTEVEEYVDWSEPTHASRAAIGHLQLGYSRELQGEADAAALEYQQALSLLPAGDDPNYYVARAEMSAYTQLGGLAVAEQDWTSASQHYEAAVRAGQQYPALREYVDPEEPDLILATEVEEVMGGLLRGAQENNLALARARSGDHAAATEAAQAAVARDPASPVFLDTAAFAHDLAGDGAAAAGMYEQAIAADATSYVSMNNLAVIRAEEGDVVAADRLLRQALDAQPEYGVAWHNVSVLWSQSWAPDRIVAAQGAASRAVRQDGSLRDVPDTLRMDRVVYDSGLDVSRPLRADWSYAASATERVDRFALTALALVVLRVLWGLGMDQVGGRLWEKSVRRRDGVPRRWRALTIPRHSSWAIGLSATLLTGATLWSDPSPDTVLAAVSICGLLVLPVALRHVLSGREPGHVSHFSWPPAMLASLVAAPAGLAFAPYPSLEERGTRSRRLLWSAPLAAASVATVFALVSLVTGTPLASGLAAAALVVCASMMTPVAPLDGSRLQSRPVAWAVTAALTLGTVALILNWI